MRVGAGRMLGGWGAGFGFEAVDAGVSGECGWWVTGGSAG